MSDFIAFVATCFLCATAGWFMGGAVQHSVDASDLRYAKIIHRRDVTLRESTDAINRSQAALIDLLLKKLEARR